MNTRDWRALRLAWRAADAAVRMLNDALRTGSYDKEGRRLAFLGNQRLQAEQRVYAILSLT